MPNIPRGSSSPCRPSPGSAYRELRPEVDELMALMRPEPFYRVGASYEDFSQMSDAELIDLLERARSYTASPDVAGVVETGGEE
jgi:predicted phosphoribosyltransferase